MLNRPQDGLLCPKSKSSNTTSSSKPGRTICVCRFFHVQIKFYGKFDTRSILWRNAGGTCPHLKTRVVMNNGEMSLKI